MNGKAAKARKPVTARKTTLPFALGAAMPPCCIADRVIQVPISRWFPCTSSTVVPHQLHLLLMPTFQSVLRARVSTHPIRHVESETICKAGCLRGLPVYWGVAGTPVPPVQAPGQGRRLSFLCCVAKFRVAQHGGEWPVISRGLHQLHMGCRGVPVLESRWEYWELVSHMCTEACNLDFSASALILAHNYVAFRCVKSDRPAQEDVAYWGDGYWWS